MTETDITDRLAAGLLAEGAATAERPAGACRLCQRAILRGDRYAVTVPDGRLAHLMCLGARFTPRRAVPVIR